MRKVLITLASILAVVGIILLNALTFSSRYAKMMETTVTITSVDDSFMGEKDERILCPGGPGRKAGP